VLVRTDIPVADQIVQVGHVCLEAGFKFPKPNEVIHLIVLCIGSEIQLLSALEMFGLQGIHYIVFQEPDDGMGFTAACTEPLNANYRGRFRKFQLWNASREVNKK
jgi:hypothetical protein